ncbi:hypothetical protein RFI_16532 [Reticulomyxa filosa]|uniref:Uncharacterized protein n=1 Tax=Reticulomyxa filosa TaxID=46433 RepID=X6N4J6_RETFI|nr:hypothetical protein RFI_16532 [Reticulomyxa filosa]|eukprot:ETO20684.1 hypothetical protein RFI_16532 [Reticulomyxa filosa]
MSSNNFNSNGTGKIIDDKLLGDILDLNDLIKKDNDLVTRHDLEKEDDASQIKKEVEEGRRRYLEREKEKEDEENVVVDFHKIGAATMGMKSSAANCDTSVKDYHPIDLDKKQAIPQLMANARKKKTKSLPMLSGTIGHKPSAIHQTSNIYKSTFSLAQQHQQQFHRKSKHALSFTSLHGHRGGGGGAEEEKLEAITTSREKEDGDDDGDGGGEEECNRKFPELCHYRIIYSGYLLKKGFYYKSLKRRYCLLLAQQIDVDTETSTVYPHRHGNKPDDPIVEYHNDQDRQYMRLKVLQHYHSLFRFRLLYFKDDTLRKLKGKLIIIIHF